MVQIAWFPQINQFPSPIIERNNNFSSCTLVLFVQKSWNWQWSRFFMRMPNFGLLWLFLANFGYFVAHFRTLWSTFSGLKKRGGVPTLRNMRSGHRLGPLCLWQCFKFFSAGWGHPATLILRSLDWNSFDPWISGSLDPRKMHEMKEGPVWFFSVN